MTNKERQDGAAAAPVRKIRLINGKKMRIMVLDDHPVVTLGTSTMLAAQQDMLVDACHQDAAALQQALAAGPCDVAVIDFHLPGEPLDGGALIRRLRLKHPELVIVVYSSDASVETEYAVWRAGANAFLCKRSAPLLLIDMIRSARARPRVFFGVRDGEILAVSPDSDKDRLSASEIEVLRHLAQGLSVVQVAQKIHRSKQTVSSHKRSAMAKLQLADDMSLALYLKDRFSH